MMFRDDEQAKAFALLDAVWRADDLALELGLFWVHGALSGIDDEVWGEFGERRWVGAFHDWREHRRQTVAVDAGRLAALVDAVLDSLASGVLAAALDGAVDPFLPRQEQTA